VAAALRFRRGALRIRISVAIRLADFICCALHELVELVGFLNVQKCERAAPVRLGNALFSGMER
jgi:hypothetical protein